MENQSKARGRKSGEGQHLERVLALYRAGSTVREIMEVVPASRQTILRWLHRAGVEIDPKRGMDAPRGPLSDEHKDAISQAKGGVEIAKRSAWRGVPRTCLICKDEFIPKRGSQVTCGKTACRVQRGADAVRKDRFCPCGKALPPFTRSSAIYCSPECRAKYGQKRQRIEANYRKRTCRNCGEEFEWYIRGGSGYYCSNECAMKHTKTKHHVVLKDDDVLLDSTYEGFVWCALKIAKVPVERFDRAHAVEWAPGRFYGPDLWLPREQIAIECKGYQDADDEARWAAYRAQRGALVVIAAPLLGSMAEALAFVATRPDPSVLSEAAPEP